jgi:hypothetical protein
MHRLIAVSVIAIIVVLLLVVTCKQGFTAQDRLFGVAFNPKIAARRIF